MKEIRLSGGGNVAIVDDEDFESLSGYPWTCDRKGYAGRSEWLGLGMKARKFHFMHRQILGITDPKIRVDHINGNTLDNRRSNLRACNDSQNQMNRGKTKSNTSGFKGVSLTKSRRSWQARIKVNGREQYLGCFPTPEQAHAAYVEAAKLHHGEFYRAASDSAEGSRHE